MSNQETCLECQECPGCDDPKCQQCCEHAEHDHYVCLDCGKELDPGDDIDDAYDRLCDQLAEGGQ